MAIGKIVLHDREDVVAMRAYQKAIILHILKYLEEIRPIDEISEITELHKKKNPIGI